MSQDDDQEARVPAWAERARREAFSRSAPPRAAPTSGLHRWLDEPWQDLANNLPGAGLLATAAAQRHVGESDLSWRVGADGEDILANALAELTHPRRITRWLRSSANDAPWLVLHGAKIGASARADLDHVLIGPPGVVVINTKKLDPRYRVTIDDGEIHTGRFSTDFVAKASRDAERAWWLLASAAQAVVSRRARGDLPPDWDLSPYWAAVESIAAQASSTHSSSSAANRWPPTIPALAFVGSGSVEERLPSPVVARASTICATLRQHRAALDRCHVLALYEIARRSTTWTRDTPPKP
ncbi:nuclease-related domain-containing protein [Actinomycetospora callitridis]|uniref:nuclease-related domain-containing protein n=1 Tax=Actinomycetospora callitridis TaxID=913944 RepID=UPI0023653DDB|nr:nuclease-related domain-containing protein [Actinomycetospora callitridis]MDD7920144.1 nuclease-related domain-containing protein [Actinomycetospora callitridis]